MHFGLTTQLKCNKLTSLNSKGAIVIHTVEGTSAQFDIINQKQLLNLKIILIIFKKYSDLKKKINQKPQIFFSLEKHEWKLYQT